MVRSVYSQPEGWKGVRERFRGAERSRARRGVWAHTVKRRRGLRTRELIRAACANANHHPEHFMSSQQSTQKAEREVKLRQRVTPSPRLTSTHR